MWEAQRMGVRDRQKSMFMAHSSPSVVKPKDLRYFVINLGSYVPQKRSSTEFLVSLKVLSFPVISAIHPEIMAVVSAIYKE